MTAISKGSLKVKRMIERLIVVREAAIDTIRHLKYAAPSDGRSELARSKAHLECQITKDYHRIEKALALREPKSPFGSAVRERLIRDIERFGAAAEDSSSLVETARSAVEALDHWNAEGERTLGGPIREPICRSDMPEALAAQFFRSRASVRDYSNERVSHDDICRAVEMARNAPSVCNRQPWKVLTFHEPDTVARVLALQNGNLGFGHMVPCVSIIVVDIRLFSSSGERNQRWIDGGIFAMSFILALHSVGLASCMLNWSVDNARTRSLREIVGLPGWADVITLIAVGHPQDGHKVARSPRRSLSELMEVDPADAPDS